MKVEVDMLVGNNWWYNMIIYIRDKHRSSNVMEILNIAKKEINAEVSDVYDYKFYVTFKSTEDAIATILKWS